MLFILGNAAIFISCFIPIALHAGSVPEIYKSFNLTISSENYNPSFRPDFGNPETPAVITLDILLRDVVNLDIDKQEIGLQMTLHQEWKDPRLGYTAPEGVQLPADIRIPSDGKHFPIWVPDTVIKNELHRTRQEVSNLHTMIRVAPDGTVSLSERLSVTIKCIMLLEYYPTDQHQCHIDMGSYGWSALNIDYKWAQINPIKTKTGVANPIQDFRLESYDSVTCGRGTGSEKYSCLRAIFTFQRESSATWRLITQIYLPNFLFVAVAGLALLLRCSEMRTRLALAATTLLGTVLVGSLAMSSIPRGAQLVYDWLNASYIFTGVALMWMLICAVWQGRDDPQIASEAGHQFLAESVADGGPEKVVRRSKIPVTGYIKAWLPGVIYFVIFAIFCFVNWSHTFNLL